MDYVLRYLPIANPMQLIIFSVWYVVIDKVMEIRRIQPSRRNEENFLGTL